MKPLSLLQALVLPGFALAGSVPRAFPERGSELAGEPLLQGRRGLEGRGPCHANNCARAITGTNAKPAMTVRKADCSSFMLVTVQLPAVTVTDTAVVTVTAAAHLDRRADPVTVSPSVVPTYASACSGPAAYASACSCWGITQSATTPPAPTVTATVTSTVTVPPPIVTLTGRLRVNNAQNSNNLGFVTKNTNPAGQIQITTTENDAMIVSFEVASSATSATGVELKITNGNTPAGFPFFGFVQGRDSVNSVMSPGSFHYLYLLGSAANPGLIPANVGNAYTAATGTVRTSESAVWNINIGSGALTGVWTNPDGNAASGFQIFTQSNYLYAGSDINAFHARYPAPTTPLQLTFVPI